MALFEENDPGFNIGRGFAYFCGWLGSKLSVWPILSYYLLMFAGAGVTYAWSTESIWNPFTLGVGLFFFVIFPLVLVVRMPQVWCRVLTQRDLAALWRSNRLG